MTKQTTLDWHYLPELPPEPETKNNINWYLVANISGVHKGWHKGDGIWPFRGNVYAWATWPEAPPTSRLEQSEMSSMSSSQREERM